MSKIKKLLWHVSQELFYLVLLPFDILIPKRNNYWIFTIKHGVPWGDNMRCLFEDTLKRQELTPILLTNGTKTRTDIKSLYPNTIIHKRFSLKGIAYFLRSKVCFISYSNMELYSVLIPQFRHIIINLWHGIPIKAIGFELQKHKGNHTKRKWLNPLYTHCNYYIASSNTDQKTMARCTIQDTKRVWVTGLPRNDLLFQETTLPGDLAQEEAKLIAAKDNRKLILHAPTFRDSASTRNPLAERKHLESLVTTLAKHNAVLGIRAHPLNTSLCTDIPGIINCGSKIYSNPQIVLRNTDILISDYSGIWIDFLLLDRPIIGFCYDFDSYMKERSFLYDFKSIFAGSILEDFPALVKNLEKTLIQQDDDKSQELRKAAIKLFFKYTDNQSTARVYEHVTSLL